MLRTEGKNIHDGCLVSEPLLIRGIGWLSISLLLINQCSNRIRVLKLFDCFVVGEIIGLRIASLDAIHYFYKAKSICMFLSRE